MACVSVRLDNCVAPSQIGFSVLTATPGIEQRTAHRITIDDGGFVQGVLAENHNIVGTGKFAVAVCVLANFAVIVYEEGANEPTPGYRGGVVGKPGLVQQPDTPPPFLPRSSRPRPLRMPRWYFAIPRSKAAVNPATRLVG